MISLSLFILDCHKSQSSQNYIYSLSLFCASVIFAVDILAKFDDFRNSMTASVDSKSIFIINPGNYSYSVNLFLQASNLRHTVYTLYDPIHTSTWSVPLERSSGLPWGGSPEVRYPSKTGLMCSVKTHAFRKWSSIRRPLASRGKSPMLP